MAGAKTYRMAIRNAVRGLWRGYLSYEQFFSIMLLATEQGITEAAYTGARNCGIMPSELDYIQQRAILNMVLREQQWINGFAEAIEQSEKLTPMFKRADIWIGRFEGARDKMVLYTCEDNIRLKWIAPRGECPSCAKLDGQVRTVEYWRMVGVSPREHDNKLLACGGWNCHCTRVVTDEPLSRGRFPSLP